MSSRLVILTGSASINSIGTYAFENIIRDALTNQGFNVSAVRVSIQGALSSNINITLELDVDNAYTAEQARASAINVLSSMPNPDSILNVIGGKPLSNVSLQVVSDGTTVPFNDPTVNTTSSLDSMLQSITSGVGSVASSATAGLAANSFTPIMIGVVAIVAIFLLKSNTPSFPGFRSKK